LLPLSKTLPLLWLMLFTLLFENLQWRYLILILQWRLFGKPLWLLVKQQLSIGKVSLLMHIVLPEQMQGCFTLIAVAKRRRAF